MKLKYISIVIILLILFLGCIAAISAESVEDFNNPINQTNTDMESSLSVNESKLSPYEQFSKDLEQNNGIVYLTDDIKIDKPFILKNKTVIDGKGHTIDGQYKTVIFKSYCSLTIKNLILIRGSSTKSGGAIYSNGDLTVNNCQFINNRAAKFGGAIYSTNSNLNVINSKFEKSVAEKGGAIYSNSVLTVDKCNFINNVASNSGGAISVSNGKLTIKNSRFEKNSVKSSGVSGYGGAIWIRCSTSKIVKTVFKSNSCLSQSLKTHKKATKYKFSGGAISYSEGSFHSLSNCEFIKNRATNHGGSIFATNSNSLNIYKCQFKNNNALFEDGGAISYSGKKLSILNSYFHKNFAYEDGGAIDTYSLNGHKVYVAIKNCKFNLNTGYKGGGAIWMGVKTIYNIYNSKFTKNKATFAGAIEAEDGNAKIRKCSFVGNKAAKITSWNVKSKKGKHLNHCGGAIHIENNCQIVKCNFKSNKATYGGAIHIRNNYKIIRCNFNYNTARFGGAIYFEKNCKVLKCNFNSNHAVYGGAIHIKNKCNVIKCNFKKNVAVHGGANYIEKNGKVLKCIFKSNKATYGGAVQFIAGKLTFKSNKVISCKAKYYSGLISSKSIKISNKNKWGKYSTEKAIKKKIVSPNVKTK